MQKALVGIFIGGLKAKIADGIQTFKLHSLKDAINLALMRDDQLTWQSRFVWPPLQELP